MNHAYYNLLPVIEDLFKMKTWALNSFMPALPYLYRSTLSSVGSLHCHIYSLSLVQAYYQLISFSCHTF